MRTKAILALVLAALIAGCTMLAGKGGRTEYPPAQAGGSVTHKRTTESWRFFPPIYEGLDFSRVPATQPAELTRTTTETTVTQPENAASSARLDTQADGERLNVVIPPAAEPATPPEAPKPPSPAEERMGDLVFIGGIMSAVGMVLLVLRIVPAFTGWGAIFRLVPAGLSTALTATGVALATFADTWSTLTPAWKVGIVGSIALVSFIVAFRDNIVKWIAGGKK
jgi:hypothetical protein